MSLIFGYVLFLYNKRKIQHDQEKLHILKKSEKKYRTLVETMKDGVFVVDNNLGLLFYNQQFSSSFNKTFYSQKIPTLKEIFNPYQYSSLLQCITNAFDIKTSNNIEIEFTLHKKIKYHDITITPQLKTNGDVQSVLCITRDITNFRNMNNKLEELVTTLKSQQYLLKDLSKEIIRAHEDERKRISRDLHDEVGQTLTAINLNLQLIKNKKFSDYGLLVLAINECEELVTITMRNVRRFSYELRPVILDDFGLKTAIEKHSKDFSKRTGINVISDKLSNIPQLVPEFQTVIYRIFQEGLNNISKHANASNVKIELFKLNDKIHLRIDDDGVGFDKNKLKIISSGKGGLGLRGMEERVKLIGGYLKLNSTKNKGTKITIEVPFGES